MAVSLLNMMLAEKVTALLDDPHVRDNLKDDERGFTRDQAEAIIHAALWAYSARGGSTAEAYARMSLFDAIGLKSWSFKESLAPPALRPMATAPRDRTPVLLLCKSESEVTHPGFRLGDVMFVGRYHGEGQEWGFAAPVGYGGIPDDWLRGWMPLPEAQA